tara:strand:- start:128 stop:319 length:192 start_codon:yes stop_codon:yes gene_type:complete
VRELGIGLKVRKINLIDEDYYRVTYEFYSDFNQLIVMNQNVHHRKDDDQLLVEKLTIPTNLVK